MSADIYDVFETMQKFGGSFASSLSKAWFHADMNNRIKIEQAFPELVNEYRDAANQAARMKESA